MDRQQWNELIIIGEKCDNYNDSHSFFFVISLLASYTYSRYLLLFGNKYNANTSITVAARASNPIPEANLKSSVLKENIPA